jgi:ligand-binding sensor protein
MKDDDLRRLALDNGWQRIQKTLLENLNAQILWINNSLDDTIESFDENYHEICRFLRNNPDGLRKCQNSHHTRFQDSRRSNQPALSACYCGLMGFTIPIVSEEKLIGIIGGYIPSSDFPITIEKCAEISIVSKTDIKEIIDLAKAIKHISRAEQRQILRQLSWLAGMLPSMIEWSNKAHLISKIENRYKSYMSCLDEVYDQLKHKENMKELLNTVTEKIKLAMSVDASSIYILNQESNDLILFSTAGLPDSALGHVIKVGEGIIGYVAQTQSVLTIEDATKDVRALRVVTGSSSKRKIYRSVLSVPLISNGKLIGVIDARTYQTKSWDQSEIDFLMLISKHIADAIQPVEIIKPSLIIQTA